MIIVLLFNLSMGKSPRLNPGCTGKGVRQTSLDRTPIAVNSNVAIAADADGLHRHLSACRPVGARVDARVARVHCQEAKKVLNCQQHLLSTNHYV